jgi:hypothetical protein
MICRYQTMTPVHAMPVFQMQPSSMQQIALRWMVYEVSEPLGVLLSL